MEHLLEHGLLAVLVALLLTPFGLPIPEDVSLVAAGVLARTGHAQLYEAWIVGYFGVLFADCIAWSFGHYLGLNPRGPLRHLFGRKQILRITKFFQRFGPWAIVVCRNLPGTRFPAFFFSGATGMSLPRFVLIDGSAAVVTVSLWVSVGWWAGQRADLLDAVMARAHWLLLGLGVVLVGGLAWRLLRGGEDEDEA